MTDEPDRFLTIGADQLEVGVGPRREVVVRLRGFEKAAGLTPGIGVMLALTPDEARQFSGALSRVADAAEGQLPQA